MNGLRGETLKTISGKNNKEKMEDYFRVGQNLTVFKTGQKRSEIREHTGLCENIIQIKEYVNELI